MHSYEDSVLFPNPPPIPNSKVKLGLFICAPIFFNCAATIYNILNCANLNPQIWWGGGKEAEETLASPLQFLIPNHLELIALQFCSVLLTLFSIVLAPILRYKGMVFGAQRPIANFGVRMISISWVSMVLNFAAIIFDRTRFIPEICASFSNIYI